MLKLPNGISNYEKIVEGEYCYVDKTMYIEKLEELSNPNIMFLRPRKFGKTLFTSVIENYYDILKKDKFEKLFSRTYIGQNPTGLQNSYHILKFNFSGIDTSSVDNTIIGFKNSAMVSIKDFVQTYNLDFYINEEQTAEDMLNSLIQAFKSQKAGERIYVIIDEYDHFANELLGFKPESFKSLVAQNGKVRKWYEVLKKGTESVVDRIFITGVAPITLDSMTSGFNISKDITQDVEFNEMVGFTEQELINLMSQNISKEQQEVILPIMRVNYDGYNFSLDGKYKMYNSNMCLFFLSNYIRFGKIPEKLIDVNIASDYSKLSNMLRLCTGTGKKQIIEDIISGKGIISDITDKFNPAIKFTEKDMVSMLYYLGYLTIVDSIATYPKLAIPNKVMKELYSEYFLEVLSENMDLEIDYGGMAIEVAVEGKIKKIIELLEKLLNNLSNRDYMNFDEKYVKLIFYTIAMNLRIYQVKSEMEVRRKYPDILLIPRERDKGYNSVMIEFKYLKKGEEGMLEQKQVEAKEQIQEYAQFEDIKDIEKMHKYTVVAVVDKIYVEEIH